MVGRSRAERARAGRCGAGPGEECISGGRRAWRVADHNILGLADRAAGWEGGREGGRKKEGRKTNDSNKKETCEVVNQMHQSISNYNQALVSIRGQRSEGLREKEGRDATGSLRMRAASSFSSPSSIFSHGKVMCFPGELTGGAGRAARRAREV